MKKITVIAEVPDDVVEGYSDEELSDEVRSILGSTASVYGATVTDVKIESSEEITA